MKKKAIIIFAGIGIILLILILAKSAVMLSPEQEKVFWDKVSGVWVDGWARNAYDYHYYEFADGMVYKGHSSGETSRPAKVSGVFLEDENTYKAQFFYEATSSESVEIKTVTITFSEGAPRSISFDDEFDRDNREWYYYGPTVEDAHQTALNYWGADKEEEDEEEDYYSSDTTTEHWRSDIKPNNWYYLSSNKAVQAQNAEISNAVYMSSSKVYMITYYPVCTSCHYCGDLQMTGASVEIPVTEGYYCSDCSLTTYCHFRIEY